MELHQLVGLGSLDNINTSFFNVHDDCTMYLHCKPLILKLMGLNKSTVQHLKV